MASSANPPASATLSCTPLVAARSARPNTIAAPTTTGVTASVVSVRCVCVSVSSTMPPTRNSTCRVNSLIHVFISVCSVVRSLDKRLVSSPVRRSAK